MTQNAFRGVARNVQSEACSVRGQWYPRSSRVWAASGSGADGNKLERQPRLNGSATSQPVLATRKQKPSVARSSDLVGEARNSDFWIKFSGF